MIGDKYLKNRELLFALISGVFWIFGILLASIQLSGNMPVIFYSLSILAGSIYTTYYTYKSLAKGQFSIDLLMLLAAFGAVFLGNFSEGSLLLFLFSLGHALEHYATEKARKSISALKGLSIESALIMKEERLLEVKIESIEIGDIIVCKPNTKIAADGVVIDGSSRVNEAPITGESFPVEKVSFKKNLDIPFHLMPKNNKVFAGSINGNNTLFINVRKKANDTTLSRMITMIEKAESQRSNTQKLSQRFEKIYVPIVLILVLGLMSLFLFNIETFEESFYRAITVLIAASPCALAISIPSAILAAIARGAQKGVLFKGGLPIELLSGVKAIAFDKTGTLTIGQPRLTKAQPYGDVTEKELLEVVLAVESLSDHPIAIAIVKACYEKMDLIQIQPAKEIKSISGKGVTGIWQNQKVYIGNRELMRTADDPLIPEEIEKTASELENEGQTTMIVKRGNQFLGVLAVSDIPRDGSYETIRKLEEMKISKLIMLSGDHQKVADAIAKKVGLSSALGSLLPEDKIAQIKELKEKYGMVAMVGDGVNDAPAMMCSNIGIAMGAAGSDVALETADIALMGDQIAKLPFAINLSREAKKIIYQNLLISISMVLILVPLSLFDFISIGLAVVGHEGSTVIVVLNALRLLGFED